MASEGRYYSLHIFSCFTMITSYIITHLYYIISSLHVDYLSSIKALNHLIAFEANHHLCSSFLVARSSSHVRIQVSPLPPFFFRHSRLFDVNPLTLSHNPARDFSSRLFFRSLEQKKERKMPRRGLEPTPPPS